MKHEIEWKRAKTAPKDGSVILLWGPTFVHAIPAIWEKRQEPGHRAQDKLNPRFVYAKDNAPLTSGYIYEFFSDVRDYTMWAEMPSPVESEDYEVEDPAEIAEIIDPKGNEDSKLAGIAGFLRRLADRNT